jgi:hypothetical protein
MAKKKKNTVDTYIDKLNDDTEEMPTYSGADRDLNTELAGAVSASNTYGSQLSADSLSQLGTAATTLQVYDNINKEWAREGEIDDIATLGTGMRDALMYSTPEYATLADWAANTGASDIETELTTQAESDLALGRSLSDEQVRAATQQARAGMSARGLGTGTGALAAEVLNRDAYATEREDSRRTFAAGVEALNQNRVNNDRTFVGNVATALDAQTRLDAVTSVDPTDGYNSVYTDDILSYSNSLNSGNQDASLGAYTAELTAYQDSLETLGSYYNSLMNAEASTTNSKKNNSSSIWGSLIGAVGTVAGGIAGGPLGAAAGTLLGSLGKKTS